MLLHLTNANSLGDIGCHPAYIGVVATSQIIVVIAMVIRVYIYLHLVPVMIGLALQTP